MSDVEKEIGQYLFMGGLFNPEQMEHHKVLDLLMKCRDEIERLKDKCDRQAFVLRRMYVEQYPDTWFVAGNGLGERDQNNLPKYIEVCPAYGCDWTQIYERTERTIGGMGS
jgi:hypothetical protein